MSKSLKNTVVNGELTKFIGGAEILQQLSNNFNNFGEAWVMGIEKMGEKDKMKVDKLLKDDKIEKKEVIRLLGYLKLRDNNPTDCIIPKGIAITIGKIREEVGDKIANSVSSITTISNNNIESILKELMEVENTSDIIEKIKVAILINIPEEESDKLKYNIILLNEFNDIFMTIEDIEISFSFDSIDEMSISYPVHMSQYQIAASIRQLVRLPKKDLEAVVAGKSTYDGNKQEIVITD